MTMNSFSINAIVIEAANIGLGRDKDMRGAASRRDTLQGIWHFRGNLLPMTKTGTTSGIRNSQCVFLLGRP